MRKEFIPTERYETCVKTYKVNTNTYHVIQKLTCQISALKLLFKNLVKFTKIS